MTRDPGDAEDCDALHVEGASQDEVVRALDRTCSAEGLHRADPGSLMPLGTFRHGEEDPSQRRFLVSPPAGRWTTILMSAPDWDHDWAPSLLERLGGRGVYLMLHDGDVMTLHLHEGAALAASVVTSPAHFDAPHLEPDARLAEALGRFAGRRVTESEALATCFPPGRLDVDGRLAFARVAELLSLPHAAWSYARAVSADGSPDAAFSGWIHVGYRRDEPGTDADDADARGAPTGHVLPFRRRAPP